MYYEENSRTFNIVAGLAFGALVGAGAALLLLPQDGRRSRNRLAVSVNGVRKGTASRLGGVTDDVRALVGRGGGRLLRR